MARARDVLGGVLGRMAPVRRLPVRYSWVPAPRYGRGFLAGRGRAVGRKVPQPWVLDGDGIRRRFDDVTAGRWTVLTIRAAPPAGWLTVLPPGSAPRAGAVVDTEGLLVAWLRHHRVTTVALRPDSFVYAEGRVSLPATSTRQKV